MDCFVVLDGLSPVMDRQNQLGGCKSFSSKTVLQGSNIVLNASLHDC